MDNTKRRVSMFLDTVVQFIFGENVPVTGSFSPVRIAINPQKMGGEFLSLHTDQAGLEISQDRTGGESSRRLAAYVMFPGTDRQMCNYIFKGTKGEIIEYLSRPETCDEVFETLSRLDDSMWMHD